MSHDRSRYDAMLAAQTYQRLADHPEARAEAIAHHYASHAQVATHMLTLIKARQRCSPEELVTYDKVLAHTVESIATQHCVDLGLELAWPIPSNPSCPTPSP